MGMTDRTRYNLYAALRNEALMHATLLRYAAIARGELQPQLGHIFQKAAELDRCYHFANLAEKINGGHDSVENLKCIIKEKSDAAALYGTCATESKEDGDAAIAETFEQLRQEELEAVRQLETVLSSLDGKVMSQ